MLLDEIQEVNTKRNHPLVARLNACDHDQIEAMFCGLQLDHPRHKIDATMRHIEEEYDHNLPAKCIRAKRELQRLARHSDPLMKYALLEAGIATPDS